MIQTSSALNTHAIDFSFHLAPHYLDVCDYIEKKYNECYNAQISCDYQHLLVVTNGQGEPVAAVGYRTPDTALFLEQYLNKPAEDVLSAVYKKTIHRSSIVEIGNLVGNDSRAVFFLMQELWSHLHEAQYRHAMLTCTKKLRRRFKHLPMHQVGIANKQRIANPASWGLYYEESPEVMTVRLESYDNRFSRVRHTDQLSFHYVTNVLESVQ